MQRGINKILKAVAPTLGPMPRFVGIERIGMRDSLPERLDSGGTIARRIIQIEGRNADVGAMYIRNVLFTLQEKIGDGTATAAVIFQAIYNEGLHYLVNGGSSMRLRTFLDEAVPLLHAELDSMTVRLQGKRQLVGLANTITNDPEMAPYLGEIFDIIGEYGRLEIRNGRSREIEREYIEGIFWENGVHSREMIYDKSEFRTNFQDPYILISDLEIDNPEDLVPMLELAVKHEIKSMLLICNSISDRALGLLLLKPNLEKVQIAAVKTPEIALSERIGALEDMAVLTGAQLLSTHAGDQFANIRIENFGRARRAWATTDNFGIIGGKGNPSKLREHIASLRQGYLHIDDAEDRKKILKRLGKLLGGSATLFVGDMTPNAMEARKELATRAAEAMRGAIRDGVVPGGGVALMNSAAVLRSRLPGCTDPDQLAAYRILIRALETPLRTLVQNGGGDLDEIMPVIKQAGPGYGYDVVRQEVVNMADAKIFDVVSVLKEGLYAAINGAALALTTDVIIHRKNPPESLATTS
jgi:chaperonin GroEL